MVIPLNASVRAYRPDCGLPTISELQRLGVIARYTRLSKHLQAQGVTMSKSSPLQLAVIVTAIRRYLDQNFGRESKNKHSSTITIWPAHLFSDFSNSGSLSCILFSLFSYCDKHNIDYRHFGDTSYQNDFFFHLILHIEKDLKRKHHIPSIKVFLAPTLSEKEIKKLGFIAHHHGAEVVSDSEAATHVLYPDPPNTREAQTDGQVLVRLLTLPTNSAQEKCFVHWFYHPDSYNDWVSSCEVLGQLYQPKFQTRCREQWHLQARWLRDLHLFNEWMNELDYEMPLSFQDFIGISPSAYDSCTAKSPPLPITKLRLRITPKHRNGPTSSEASIPRPTDVPCNPKTPGLLSLSDENEEQQVLSLAVPPAPPRVDAAKCLRAEILTTAFKENPAKCDSSRVERINIGNGLFIPSFSAWFSLQGVHDIETRALPEFFSGVYQSKTQITYVETRNYMILTWRKSSQRWLTATAVRKRLSGDACSIFRIHAFLEHWGLINYPCRTGVPLSAPPPPPKPLPTNAGFDDDVAMRKGVNLILDNGSKARVENLRIKRFDRLRNMEHDGSISIPVRHGMAPVTRNLLEDNNQNKNQVEYHCDSCGTDCSELRFHCATKADVDLCASCYHTGQYSPEIKRCDFLKMSSAISIDSLEDTYSDFWTENEILLLLEALEMYSDNWDLVAEHVASKGKLQCVVQFLRLPIEDSFLKSTTKEWWSEHPGQNKETPTPFDLIRKCGAHESATADIALEGFGDSKVCSGQPVVCGDQVNTIVPFLEMLTSLTPPEMVREIISRMDLSSTRTNNSFKVAFKHYNITYKERGVGNGDEHIKNALSDKLYWGLLKQVKTPAEILQDDLGRSIVDASISLLREGFIRDDTRKELRDSISKSDVVKGIRQMLKNSSSSKCSEEPMEALNSDGRHRLRIVERASSSAVALSSLCCTCVSASKLASIEDIEVGRLNEVIVEMKLELIRLKLCQLEEIVQGENKMKHWLKRKRENMICYNTLRKRRFVMGSDGDLRMREDRSVTADSSDSASRVGTCVTVRNIM